jgi:hypothetical protein
MQHESPPPAPETLETLDAKLAALEANITRLFWAFDAISEKEWRAEAFGEAGVEAAGSYRGQNLLEALCYLRDEEAYRVGRRVVRLFQEESPEFEHLTFDIAFQGAPQNYADEAPARVISEFFKNRMAWLQIARGEKALLEKRKGALPPEEGGGEIGIGEHLDWTLRRDQAVRDLILDMKAQLRGERPERTAK